MKLFLSQIFSFRVSLAVELILKNRGALGNSRWSVPVSLQFFSKFKNANYTMKKEICDGGINYDQQG